MDKYSEYFNDSFAFYSAYHKNNTNKIIHIITIPIIIYTIFIWAAYLSIYQLNNINNESYIYINAGLIIMISYFTIYALMDGLWSLPYFIYIFMLYIFATYSTYHIPYMGLWAIIIHIFAWILQFIGHGVFEGRKPALCDSVGQAICMAPYFVYVEILFMLGQRGYFKKYIDDLSHIYDQL